MRFRSSAWYVEEVRQRQRVAPDGVFSVHVSDDDGRTWRWRGVFFRRGQDLVFFGFGPRTPEFYRRLARTRRAWDRINDER